MRTISLAFALMLVLVPTMASAKVHQGVQAPDVVLKDKAGNDVKLSDYRGKVILMDFWTTWCAPCKKEVPAMEALARKYAAAGKPVVFLAINYDQNTTSRTRLKNQRHKMDEAALFTVKDGKIVREEFFYFVG